MIGNDTSWKEQVKEKFYKYSDATLRISLNNRGGINFILLKPEKFSLNSYGAFLENIKPGDVSITQKAFYRLRKIQEECSDQTLVRILPGPIIGYFVENGTYNIPTKGISVSKEAFKQLSELFIIE